MRDLRGAMSERLDKISSLRRELNRVVDKLLGLLEMLTDRYGAELISLDVRYLSRSQDKVVTITPIVDLLKNETVINIYVSLGNVYSKIVLRLCYVIDVSHYSEMLDLVRKSLE